MEGHAVNQVNLQQEKPLTWPVQADVICIFSTTEGYVSYRGWLVIALYCEIKHWLDQWEKTRQTDNVKDIEFHHLLIRVNSHNGKFQAIFFVFHIFRLINGQKCLELI